MLKVDTEIILSAMVPSIKWQIRIQVGRQNIVWLCCIGIHRLLDANQVVHTYAQLSEQIRALAQFYFEIKKGQEVSTKTLEWKGKSLECQALSGTYAWCPAVTYIMIW